MAYRTIYSAQLRVRPVKKLEERQLMSDFYVPILMLGIIAFAGDFIVPYLLGSKYPNYDNFKHVISELGSKQSPVRKQLSRWLILQGILAVIFGIGQKLLFTEQTWAHNLYVGGIIIFGIGAGVVAGIFPEDTSGAEETVTGKIHGIFSGLGFIFLIMNPLWATWIDEFDGLEFINIVFFVMGLLTFAIFLTSEKREDGILGKSGLWQRLNMLVIYSAVLINYWMTKPAYR